MTSSEFRPKLKCLTTTFLLNFLILSATSFQLPENYNPSLRPNNEAVADYIKVSAQLLSIYDVSENSNDISIDLVLHKQWTDSRLAGLTSRDLIFSYNQPIIWVPDLFIENSISSTKPGDHRSSLRLSSDGSVSHSERLTIKLNCPMKFFKFPFDRQFCDLTIGSYGYPRIHLDLIWHGLINEDTEVFDSEFSLSSVEQTSRNMRTKDGEYSRLILSIVLTRSGLRYAVRAFLPTFFLALISYATLFVKQNPDSGIEKKGRQLNVLLLGINSAMMALLIFISQINARNAPNAATVTAFDIWMYFIGFIIFNCIVASVCRVLGKTCGNSQKQDHCESSTTEISPKTATPVPILHKYEYYLKFVLPIVFILFVIIYFASYLS